MDVPSARSLFDRHHAVVYRFLRKLTGDASVAEDLSQEVFMRVVRGLETYQVRDRELAWLFRIARRLVLDRQRSASRRPVLVEELADDAPARLSQPHLGLDLDRALQRLGDVEREAFLLREIGGLGYDEIAAVTGGTHDAIRNRIHRARMSLRAALSPVSIEPRSTSLREATP